VTRKHLLSAAAIAAFFMVLLALGFVGATFAVGESIGTVVACATATTPAHTVAVDGADIQTIPGGSAVNCVTSTYTIPTETVATTTASITSPPGCVEPTDPLNDRWYSCGSAFNKPIPVGTPYRANDASLIQQLVANGPLGPSLGGTAAVYFGDNSTPLVTVYDNHPTCHNLVLQVPIPAGAQTPWGMNHGNVQSTMAVLQKDTGVEWDFYKITAPGEPRLVSGGGVSGDCGSPNSWNAEIASKFDPVLGQGGWLGLGNETCCSGRASRTYQPTGYMRPRDTKLPTGSTWDHALVVTYAGELNSHVYPATGHDGVCTDTSKCVPAGARFQLEASYPCDTTPALDIEWERQMCRTLQVYGMIVVDKPCTWPCTGGGIHSENPYSVRLDMGASVDGGGLYRFPYDSSAGYRNLPTSLLGRMHVLDWSVWTGA
jgi:hypothetical protein